MSILATEDDLIATIKALLMPAGAHRVRQVDALNGAWDEDTLKAVLRAVPGVFVFWSGGEAGKLSRSAYMDADWIVYPVTAHASGAAARRRGDSKAVGAYELVELLVALLHNHVVPDVGTLHFNGVECLFNGSIDKQGVCCYAIRFRMGTSFQAAVDAGTLTPFETFAAIYDTPTHDTVEHRHWLAGDESVAKPDAKDTVLPDQS